jgi:tRNA pseudouridine55 synthase
VNGILNLDKPAGLTSHDCVARVRKALRIKRIGHAGTLDPMATGALPLCIGQATRISEYLMNGRKTYRAEVAFGAETDSQDATGEFLRTFDASGLRREDLEAARLRFVGDLLQIPPMVSAVHHEGRRLYELARQGIEVEREPRPVTVYDLRILSFTEGATPRAEIEVACSSGTYVRTLAHDIGQALGCGAFLSSLRRTASGGFAAEDALPLEEVETAARAGKLASRLISMREALRNYPEFLLSEEQAEEIRHGRPLPCAAPFEETELVRLIGPSGDLAGLARLQSGELRPFKVLTG